MTKNVGPADRVVRIILAALLGFLCYMGLAQGWFGNWFAGVLGVVALYLLVTGLLRSCLAYKLMDLDTNNREDAYHPTDAQI